MITYPYRRILISQATVETLNLISRKMNLRGTQLRKHFNTQWVPKSSKSTVSSLSQTSDPSKQLEPKSTSIVLSRCVWVTEPTSGARWILADGSIRLSWAELLVVYNKRKTYTRGISRKTMLEAISIHTIHKPRIALTQKWCKSILNLTHLYNRVEIGTIIAGLMITDVFKTFRMSSCVRTFLGFCNWELNFHLLFFSSDTWIKCSVVKFRVSYLYFSLRCEFPFRRFWCSHIRPSWN